MLLKKISAAAAGLALLASGPALAANSAPTTLVSAAAVAQDDDAAEAGTIESYLPAIVVVVFVAVFIYFLIDSKENDGDPITP